MAGAIGYARPVRSLRLILLALVALATMPACAAPACHARTAIAHHHAGPPRDHAPRKAIATTVACLGCATPLVQPPLPAAPLRMARPIYASTLAAPLNGIRPPAIAPPPRATA